MFRAVVLKYMLDCVTVVQVRSVTTNGPFCKPIFKAQKRSKGNVFTPVCDSVHRGSLSRGVSVQRRGVLSRVGSLSRGGSLPSRVSVQEGLCPGESLSRGGSVSVQRGVCLCPEGGLSLSRGGSASVQGGRCPRESHSISLDFMRTDGVWRCLSLMEVYVITLSANLPQTLWRTWLYKGNYINFPFPLHELRHMN